MVKTLYYESDMESSDCDVVFVKAAEFDEAEVLRMLKGFLSSTLRLMSVGENKFTETKRYVFLFWGV